MPKKAPAPASSIEQQVVALLRTLNAATSTHVLRGMAQSLQLTARLGAIADLPRARDSGSNKARRELDAVIQMANKLAALLLGLHSEPLRAFEEVERDSDLHPLLLSKQLRVFALSASRAQTKLPDTPPHKGNRPKRQAHEVTRQAGTIYRRLTGKAFGRATKADVYAHPSYGPSKTFLTALFKALHMPASVSADSQLKMFLASSRITE